MESAMKTILLSLVPLVLAALPGAALAEPISTRAVAVTTAGLDVATPEGAAAMLKRARAAAERGCGESPRWDRYSDDYRRCRAETTAALVARIDAPLVTALLTGRGMEVAAIDR
jgi:UrcA family protein